MAHSTESPIPLESPLTDTDKQVLLGVYAQNLPASMSSRQAADASAFRYLSLISILGGFFASDLTRALSVQIKIAATIVVVSLLITAVVTVLRRASLSRALYITNWTIETALGCHDSGRFVRNTSVFPVHAWEKERADPVRQSRPHVASLVVTSAAVISLVWLF